MAEENNSTRENIYNANDTLDINELASLNDDISPELIEQLQNQVSINASEFTGKKINTNDDSSLFEEVEDKNEAPKKIQFDDNLDDNFIKKYKAKLNKQQNKLEPPEPAVQNQHKETINEVEKNEPIDKKEGTIELNEVNESDKIKIKEAIKTEKPQPQPQPQPQKPAPQVTQNEIENITGGNIIEKPLSKEQVEYNQSLDLLDDNVKYSKYVIYVDPENTEFIESLTVKERKNLINRILREQDDIAITKKRLNMMQTVIKHSIVVILTLAISIPIIYHVINASLEASIDNYRRSQTMFKTLYKEKGKIKVPKSH